MSFKIFKRLQYISGLRLAWGLDLRLNIDLDSRKIILQFQKVGLDSQEITDSFKKLLSTVEK
jgi:hypothetical protein